MGSGSRRCASGREDAATALTAPLSSRSSLVWSRLKYRRGSTIRVSISKALLFRQFSRRTEDLIINITISIC